VWLALAALGSVATLWQLDRLLASSSTFPGISVLGIAQVLVPAEATLLAWLRWIERSRTPRRRWGWLMLGALFGFVSLLLVGTGLLASRPPGLAPTGLALVLGGVALAAFCWWRSDRP
jgi:asparagine N-glycosylation enzyme membrane subunit Stt3